MNKDIYAQRMKERYHSDPKARAKQIEYSSRWAAENPDKVKVIHRRYYYGNHEEVLRRQRERYAEDPEYFTSSIGHRERHGLLGINPKTGRRWHSWADYLASLSEKSSIEASE